MNEEAQTKHALLTLVVKDEAEKTVEKTMKAVEFARQHYNEIKIITLQEAKANNLDLHSPEVMVDNDILRNVLAAKLKQKFVKESLAKKAKGRLMKKASISARRKKNKNKKTHR